MLNQLLTEQGKKTLQVQFCLENETIEQPFIRAAKEFSRGDKALEERLLSYSNNLWFAYATPLLANGGTNRGLPISCFLNYVDDSIKGLAENFVENAFLATNGGGIGSYWGDIRLVGEKTSRGVETPGLIPFLHVIDSQMLAYHQGSTRRGAAASYIDISHPEILSFISMRESTGGDVHRKNENMHHGVCISDEFMEKVVSDGFWQLKDPSSGGSNEVIKARTLWAEILKTRVKTGEPYIFFKDAAQKALPQAQKDLGLQVHHSNLCTEITLATSPERTAVCCLSSINLAKYREWEHCKEQFISDLITMLDNCLEIFIEKAPEEMWRAVNSAKKERSVGLGTLGFQTFLQQEGISMESQAARDINKIIYEDIKKYAVKASEKLAKDRGEPDDLKGTGLRNAHLLAIAPNATSSTVCGGVSPSIEPFTGNAFNHKTKIGSYEVRNPALVPYLEKYGKNTEEVWSSINTNLGSVQHLDFLDDEEKEIFKTAEELDQTALINLAADRQKFICQSQSLNLFFKPDEEIKKLNQAHILAWKSGLKALYYLRSRSIKSTENVSAKIERKVREEAKIQCTDDVCTMCEG